MTFILLLISIALVIAIVGMIRWKRLLLKNMIVAIVAFGIIATHFVGVLVSWRNVKTFDEQFRATLVTIPWDDKAYLESAGFDCSSDEFWNYYGKSDTFLEEEYRWSVQFSIQICKEDQESAIEAHNLLPCEDEGLYIKQNTHLIYDNLWFEFLGIPSGVVRDCTFYYNGREVWIYEIDYDSLDDSLAEQFIYGISDGA